MNPVNKDKTITVNTKLDKTGINKGMKEVQQSLNRNPLQLSSKLSAKIDTQTALKEIQPFLAQVSRQISQNPIKLKFDISGDGGKQASQKELPGIIDHLIDQVDTKNLGKYVRVHIFKIIAICFEYALHAREINISRAGM